MSGATKLSTTIDPARRVLIRRARATRSYGHYQARPMDFLGSFQAVLERWMDETAFCSNPSDITSHPSYRALVQNAQVAAPLILAELRKGPSPLVWVLDDAFPSERPYAYDKVGDLEEMTQAWLAWGDQRGRDL